MKKHLTFSELTERIFRRLTRKLGLSSTLLAEEQLENVLREDKRQRFIDDIISIRRSGDYFPDYNKPKKYTEYNIVYEVDGVEKSISYETKISCERPQDFVGTDGSVVNAASKWYESIHESKQSIQQECEKKEVEFAEAMNKRYRNLNILMNAFTRIN